MKKMTVTEVRAWMERLEFRGLSDNIVLAFNPDTTHFEEVTGGYLYNKQVELDTTSDKEVV